MLGMNKIWRPSSHGERTRNTGLSQFNMVSARKGWCVPASVEIWRSRTGRAGEALQARRMLNPNNEELCSLEKGQKGQRCLPSLFGILVVIRYFVWWCFVIGKSLHRCEHEVKWLDQGHLQPMYYRLQSNVWVTPLIHLNHFSHMFRSRHFPKPKWIFDTLKASQRGPISTFQRVVLCLDSPQMYPCWVQNLQVGAQAWVYLMLPKNFSFEAKVENLIYCKAKKGLHTPTYRKFLCPLWFIHLKEASRQHEIHVSSV